MATNTSWMVTMISLPNGKNEMEQISQISEIFGQEYTEMSVLEFSNQSCCSNMVLSISVLKETMNQISH